MKNIQQLCTLLQQCSRELSTSRNFDTVYWILQIFDALAGICFRLLGYILVILAYFLILSIALSGFTITLPLITQNQISFWYIFNYLVGIIMVINLLFNYSMAVFSSPGYPSLGHVSHLSEYRQCKKCESPKPDRAHHCSICNKCILKV